MEGESQACLPALQAGRVDDAVEEAPAAPRVGQEPIERPVATARNETWSMDFMSDDLFNGDRIRLFTLVASFDVAQMPSWKSSVLQGDIARWVKRFARLDHPVTDPDQFVQRGHDDQLATLPPFLGFCQNSVLDT